MVTKIMEWVSITALLLAAAWRPFAGVLALFFIKHEFETYKVPSPRAESL
jgi:hypothetical protein